MEEAHVVVVCIAECLIEYFFFLVLLIEDLIAVHEVEGVGCVVLVDVQAAPDHFEHGVAELADILVVVVLELRQIELTDRQFVVKEQLAHQPAEVLLEHRFLLVDAGLDREEFAQEPHGVLVQDGLEVVLVLLLGVLAELHHQQLAHEFGFVGFVVEVLLLLDVLLAEHLVLVRVGVHLVVLLDLLAEVEDFALLDVLLEVGLGFFLQFLLLFGVVFVEFELVVGGGFLALLLLDVVNAFALVYEILLAALLADDEGFVDFSFGQQVVFVLERNPAGFAVLQDVKDLEVDAELVVDAVGGLLDAVQQVEAGVDEAILLLGLLQLLVQH